MFVSNNDTIQRCPHDSENPYAQISRALIRDESISPECRWLIIYMLSMKDGWKINVKQIYSHVKKFVGRDRVYKILEEAIEAGYLLKQDNFKGNLKKGCTYYLSESPKFKKCFRHPGFQETENQEALSNNNSSSYEEEKREGVKTPEPPPTPIFYQIHKRVKMKMELYDKLCEEFGVPKIIEMMDRLDEYADINPKRFKQYACHAAVIRKWIRDDKDKTPKASQYSQDWIAKIKEIFKNDNHVSITPTGITFSHGYTPIIIKFADAGAKEQVISRMRKMNLPVDRL
jgi:hypothetical protein